ncbi:MAG: hypothetical protein EOP84_07715 [Verrucomicrobiaceae bacterium]|nr:MAG: hypothetical protein EOP84_07715 [Verrucomicrobiaceae bacterium]
MFKYFRSLSGIQSLLRKHFITGVFVLIPFAVVAWIAFKVFLFFWAFQEFIPASLQPEQYFEPWVAQLVNFGIVLVRTNPEKEKHKGLTMFVIDMKAPGVEVRPIHQMSGGSNFNEVYFTDVRISDSERLGEVGNGWNVALVTLMNERLAVGGSAGPEYGEILELARNTPSPSGRGTLLQDQAFREKLASWYVSAEGYTLGKYRTMTALSKGQTPGPENSIGKLLNANRMQDIGNAAIEGEDHYGIISDPTLAAMQGAFHNAYMWAPGLRIAGGTDEILRNIIAERVLGLPQDARADKGVAFKDLPTGR